MLPAHNNLSTPVNQSFLTELARLVGPDGFISDASDVLTYE